MRFHARITDYELTVSVPDREDEEEEEAEGEELWDDEFADTIAFGDIVLTDEQRLLLLALAEPTLRDPHVKQDLPPIGRWPAGSAGRSPSSTASSTTSATGSPSSASADSAARSTNSPPIAAAALVDHAIDSGLIAGDQLDRLPPEPD